MKIAELNSSSRKVNITALVSEKEEPRDVNTRFGRNRVCNVTLEDDSGNIFKAEAVDEDVIMASTKAFMQGINKALNFKKATIKATEGAI